MFSSNTTQTSGGYEIQRSLRFNSADTTYLSRTPASAGNRRTWTWSGWVKRSSLNATGPQQLFAARNGAGNPTTSLNFMDANAGNVLRFEDSNGADLRTTPSYRDASAWYHIVLSVDTTQATASNRVRIYVNNVEVTAFSTSTYPTQNTDTTINATFEHRLGAQPTYGDYFSGYMTEVNFIDGQALTPSSFGEINADTGVWQPKRYAGSYGTNGFYLNFSNNSNTTAATLGADYSGNGNNWTPNNFSVSAGAGNDSLVDSPTSYGTDTGVGGTVRGNYCTLNPLDRGPTYVLANGNLDASTSHSTDTVIKTTVAVNSGKWYAEVVYTTIAGAYPTVGIVASDYNVNSSVYIGQTPTSYGYGAIGTKLNNGSAPGYGASWTTGDVIGIAFDLDAGTITFYKNGTSQGVAYSGIPLTNSYCVAFSTPGSVNAFVTNFGQRSFAYTAPSGFKALNTQNLPTPTIGATPATRAGKFFNPVTYTGDGVSGRTISGVGFQPDFTWVKVRSRAEDHILADAVRGGGKSLSSNTTSAEATNFTWGYVSAFASDGFVVNQQTGINAVNGSGETYVGWNWKANGAGVTNTAGSITSTVSANTTSGFSVVTWTHPSLGTQTIGHGLGVAPKMIIVKSRTSTEAWAVYHASLGATKALELNGTGAAVTSSAYWNDTAPTSTVFSKFNGAVNLVAYCFAEVPGYSRFGSYVGNGSSDGPFVFCGFRPAYVLVKRTDGADDWHLFDNRRDGFNVTNDPLYPNGSYAEGSGYNYLDLVSNGFKCRNNSYINNSGVTYIFAAFAEAPQKFALAR